MDVRRVAPLVFGGLVFVAASVAGAARPPCPSATYEVQDGPLLPGAPPTQIDTVQVTPDPASIALSIGCGPINAIKPDKVRGGKRGTKIRATWEGCAALEGKIRLKGVIIDSCGTLNARLRAKNVKRSFLATGGAGACDPVAPAGAQGCAVGQKCTWVVVQDTPETLGTTACVADGVKDSGDSCARGPVGETTGFDDCKAGLICVSNECTDICGFDGTPNAACATGYSCTRYAGLFADGSDEPIAGACAPGCDPITQLTVGGAPCPAGQGCYLLRSQTETIGICAGAGSIGHGEIIPGQAFANSCLPGHQPRTRSEGSAEIECGALCRPADVYQGMNEASEGGVAPYTCEAKGALPPSDPAGESCRYYWALEPFAEPSPYSNSVGWCFSHGAFLYDTNGDGLNDAPFPRCVTLTTGDVVPPIGNPPHNDAQYFWCTALPPAGLIQADQIQRRME